MASKKEIPRELSIYINDKEVVNSIAGITREIGKTNGQMRNLNKNSATYDADLKKLKNQLGDLKVKQSEFKDEIYGTQTAFGKLKSAIGPVGASLLAAFSIDAVITGFMSALKGASKLINDFEQGVADLSAITGATGKDLEYLKKQAIDLGKETKGGAVAVVEAYKLIASAKPELLENVQALNQVTEAALLLSKAAGMEMPEAATALTDAMNQFGVDASQATVFVDALANGAKYGAAEIPQVTEALLKFGAVARSSNVDIKESTALVELLAENGLKGAEAGTALRNILLKISAPDALPKEAKEIIAGLGISMEFLKDKTIPVQEKLEALKPLLKDNANIVKVFGLENATAALNVIGHTDRISELTSKMGEVGTATEQAAIKMDTVQEKTELLASTYDSFILSVSNGGGAVSGFFKFWIEGASNALIGLIRLNSSWDELYARALNDGKTAGTKSFSSMFNNLAGTGSNADIAKSIKTVAVKNLTLLQESYKENEQKIIDKNPWRLSFSGPSPRDLKLKKEELTKQIAAEAAIIKEAKTKIAGVGAVTTDPPVAPDAPGLTEEQKKAAEAKVKQYDDTEKKIAEIIKSAQDQRLINSKEGFAKEEEQINLKYANYITQAAGHTEKIKELEALRDQELADAKIKRDAENDARIQTAKDELEILKAETDEEKEILKAEQDFEKHVLALEKLQLDKEEETALLALLEESQGLKLDEIRKKFREKQAASDKKTLEDKKKLNEEILNGAIGLAGAETRVGQALIAVKGIMAAKETLIQLGVLQTKTAVTAAGAAADIAGGTAATAKVGFPQNIPLLIAFAAQVAGILSAIKNAAKPKVSAPKFYHGGDTGNSPALGYDEYGAVTGVVHKNEYIIPEAMTQNPRYANTIAWLEQERSGLKKYFNGGGSSADAVPSLSGAAADNSLLTSILFNLNATLANGIKAQTIIGYQEAEGIDTLNKERQQSIANGTLNS